MINNLNCNINIILLITIKKLEIFIIFGHNLNKKNYL